MLGRCNKKVGESYCKQKYFSAGFCREHYWAERSNLNKLWVNNVKNKI